MLTTTDPVVVKCDAFRRALALCNAMMCARCGTHEMNQDDRFLHGHGGLYHILAAHCTPKLALEDFHVWFHARFSANLINLTAWLSALSLQQQQQIQVDVLTDYSATGAVAAADWQVAQQLLAGLPGIVEPRAATLNPDLDYVSIFQKILHYRHLPWAKHSPEIGFNRRTSSYPEYNDSRPVAVEVGDLRTMTCIQHGDDRLYLMGLIPLSLLKSKVKFTTDGIPTDWGRDHPYFISQPELVRDDWIFCHKHHHRPLTHTPHLSHELESDFKLILAADVIQEFVRLADKFYAVALCYAVA